MTKGTRRASHSLKGKKGLVIQNDKGVVINLKGREIGLALDLTTEGLNIKDVEP